MTRRWNELEIETMLDYRDQGMTEPKIAERMSLIFMRKFTYESVNRKIRDLKKSGYIEQNRHNGRWSNALGKKRIVLKKDNEVLARQKRTSRGSKRKRVKVPKTSPKFDD